MSGRMLKKACNIHVLANTITVEQNKVALVDDLLFVGNKPGMNKFSL